MIALDTNILIRLIVRGAKGRARGARTTYTFERILARQEGFSLLD